MLFGCYIPDAMCIPYKHAPVYSFFPSHICRIHPCDLAGTCYQHFWQNDQDLYHLAVVIQGWNIYQNKSQHRKLTLKKGILLLLLLGIEPTTFQPRVQPSNTELPLPRIILLPPFADTLAIREFVFSFFTNPLLLFAT